MRSRNDLTGQEARKILTQIIILGMITIALARLRAFTPLVDIVCTALDSEASPAARQSAGLALVFIAGILAMLALFVPDDEKGEIR